MILDKTDGAIDIQNIIQKWIYFLILCHREQDVFFHFFCDRDLTTVQSNPQTNYAKQQQPETKATPERCRSYVE